MSNPNVPGELPPHPNRGSNRTVLIIIGVVAALVLVIVGSYLGTRIAQDDRSDTASDLFSTGDPVAADQDGAVDQNYDDVDLLTLTVEQFYSDSVYPEEYRLRWANQIIQERSTPSVTAQMNALMTAGNRPRLGDIVPASADNTGDQILAQQSLASYIASIEPDPNLGRKLLAGVASPSNPGFSNLLNQLGAGQDPIAATYIVARDDTTLPPRETPTFFETAIGNYVPGGVPTKFMMIQNTFDGKFSEITVKFAAGRWIRLDNTEHDQPWR